MRDLFQRRAGHYLLLVLAHLAMTLPNLGSHALWDMDEGVNAEAGREMIESGNWITPYFNYELRSAKPALLYWLQGSSYLAFGVNEFAARFPAVICGLVTLLLTYELARRMFSPATGLIAGFALASCIEFCMISHAATPDPPLLMFMTLTFSLYWFGSSNGNRWWFVPTACAMGLAVLAKGPIGLGLPALIIVLHLAATKSLGKLVCMRTLHGISTFFAVCAPWYIMVTLDTKGRWTKAFFMNENVNRFNTAMDNHSAGPWFHVAFLFVLLTPWSVFLIGSIWLAVRNSRTSIRQSSLPEQMSAYRFLLIWVAVFLVVFSIAATKLPNYVLPVYPALAILIGRFLTTWQTDQKAIPGWMMPAAMGGLFLTGIIVFVGLQIAGGKIQFDFIKLTPMPELASWAWIGTIPSVAAIACVVMLRRKQPSGLLGIFAGGAVAFLALMAGFVPLAFEGYKVPKSFALVDGLKQTDRDIRIGTYNWYRESLVFYAQREVTRVKKAEDINDWLKVPKPCYVIVRNRDWPDVSKLIKEKYREVNRRYDFLSRDDVIVISNTDEKGEILTSVWRP